MNRRAFLPALASLLWACDPKGLAGYPILWSHP